jgi:hypothetical protein
MSCVDENAIQFAFQSLDPRAQSRSASDAKANKQMNVIGHEHVPPYADSKVNCSLGVFDEGSMYLRRG